jgi:hypothetical protein
MRGSGCGQPRSRCRHRPSAGELTRSAAASHPTAPTADSGGRGRGRPRHAPGSVRHALESGTARALAPTGARGHEDHRPRGERPGGSMGGAVEVLAEMQFRRGSPGDTAAASRSCAAVIASDEIRDPSARGSLLRPVEGSAFYRQMAASPRLPPLVGFAGRLVDLLRHCVRTARAETARASCR